MSALSESSKTGVDLKAIEAIVNPIIWAWAQAHANDVVFHYTGKVLFFPVSVSVKVSNCFALLTQLVGPPASASSLTIPPAA